MALSVVILVGEWSPHLESTLRAAFSRLETLGAEHEVLVVAHGPDERASAALERMGVGAAGARVFFLTREVDGYTAAWLGIDNARGDRIAVLDSASDDIDYLPELLRRAELGADLVFAHDTDRSPRRSSRAVAHRLVEAVHGSLGVITAEKATPQFRVLSRQVVSFIAQHPDPIAAYRRLPAGSSFSRVHLQYGTKASGVGRGGYWRRTARRTRRLVAAALDTLTRLQGYDTTFHDPAGGDESSCLQKVPALRCGAFEIAKALRSDTTGWYYPANPTIVQHGRQTWVNVRLVNYRKQGHGSRIAGDGVYRSRNVFFEWNARSGVMGAAREASGVPAAWAQDTRVRGLEDQRWVEHDGRIWFSACCSQVPHDEGCAKMVLGRLNEALDGVDHLVPLRYDAARDAEKNWLLWSLGGKLLAIYGYQPLTLLSVDTTTGRAQPHRIQRADFPARRLRGSAGPVPVPERPGHWLVLVHEVARRFEKPVYAHRWLLVHLDLGMVAYSRPFVFDHVGIEYAAGLLDNGDGTLTVTYGFEDREARWAVLDRERVLASLYTVRQLHAPPGATHALEQVDLARC